MMRAFKQLTLVAAALMATTAVAADKPNILVI